MTVVTNDPTAIGTNAWTNPTYAYLDDTSKATAVMVAKNTSIAGIWGTFGFTDPGGGATISNVEIGTQHSLSTITSIIATMGREISWDGGSSWGSHTLSEAETEVTTETAYWVDVTADTTWTWAKLNDTNLKVRITCYQGNDTTGFTMNLDVVFVRVTYSTVTNISVTDTVAAGDAVLAHHTFTLTETISLADSKLVGKTLPLSDTVTLADSKSVNKTLTETDAIALADSKLVNKTIPLTDTVALADVISELLKFIFKDVTDGITLTDAVLRDKALVISENIGLADSDLRNKTLTETDALGLLDQVLLNAGKLVTDDITLSESVLVDKLIAILDGLAGDDAIDVVKTAAPVETTTGGGSSKPFRWTYVPTKEVEPEKPRRKPTAPKLILVTDFVHLTDEVRLSLRSFTVRDAATLTDWVRVDKRITLTDTVSAQDELLRHRYMMIEETVRMAESLSIFATIPDRMPILRERSLEVAETIRMLAKGAKVSALRKRLANVKDPSQTKRVENAYASELDALFRTFKTKAAQILGRRELSDDWDEVDAPDLMEEFNREIEVTITIPGKGIVKKFTTRAYTAGGLRSSQLLSSLGIKAVFSILPADKGAIDILLTRDLSGLKGITDEMSKQIMAEITDGMLRGDSMDAVARAIDDRIDSIGRTRAETLARTETMKAFAEGSLVQYDKHGITEVDWLAAPGERTCDECMSMDGQRFAIDSRPDLPAHPNCRCVWLPVVPEVPKD